MTSTFARAMGPVAEEMLAGIGRAKTRDAEREAIRLDPVGFCRDVLDFDPWAKQAEIIESVRDHRRTAVRSGHGVGKTAIAARTALWFLAAYPHSRVVTTAPTWHQVKDLLWRELRSAHARSKGRIGGALSDTRLEFAEDWFGTGLSTNEPERFQGHHAEHLLLIVDEASGVPQAIFDAAQGFLTGAGARVLLLGNPTQLSGEFYDAFHKNGPLYSTIVVSALDAPEWLVDPAWITDSRRKFGGEESPLWQVRVLGEFPSRADDAVIGLTEVVEAQGGERASMVATGVPVVVSCDVARFGSDETIVAVRRGDALELPEDGRRVGADTMEVAGLVLRIAQRVREEGADFPWIVIDDAGLGGGVVDRLRETLPPELAPRLVAFNGANVAHQPTEYPNRRSEVWFDFAEQWLPHISLPPDVELAADLVAPKYRLDSKGRRVVEPKEETKRRLGRSPDRADAVLMAFSIDGRTPAAMPESERRRPSGRISPDLRRGMSL